MENQLIIIINLKDLLSMYVSDGIIGGRPYIVFYNPNLSDLG